MTTSAHAQPPPARPVTPVGILAATLDRVVAGLDDVAGIPDDVRADLARARELAGGLDGYVETHTTPESPALATLADRTRRHDWDAHGGTLEQEMLSGHVEGQTLRMLVHACRARRVLEVGMFTGYSALAMAEALPDDGVVVACELDPDVAALARESFDASGLGDRIVVEVGPAADTLRARAAAGERFDLVFVDADKAGYDEYVDLLLAGGLLAPHGLLAVDNTLMQGEPWTTGRRSPNGEAIARFNEHLTADPRVEQVVLPLRDGLTLARRVTPEGDG